MSSSQLSRTRRLLFPGLKGGVWVGFFSLLLFKLHNRKDLMKDFQKELLGGLAYIYGPTTSQRETKTVFFQKQHEETTEANVTRQTAVRVQLPALTFARLHTKKN